MSVTKPQKKVDRRILRTKASLTAALLDLMQEINFGDITIKDITDRANMNRATFYLHYGTKEELLITSLESRFDELVQSIESGLTNTPDNPIWSDDTYDRLVFEHVAEHIDLYKVILDQNGMGSIIHRIIDYIAAVGLRNTLESINPNAPIDIPHEIVSRHVAGSMFAIIVWWVRNDMPYSSAEMANMCHRLVSFGCIPGAGGPANQLLPT